MKQIIKSLRLAAVLVPMLAVSSLHAQTHVQVSVPLFSEDFSTYSPGTMPSTVENGGLWGTTTWVGPEGSAGVVEDAENVFAEGVTNKFLRLTSTRNMSLVTPNFFEQEVISYAFDFIGHVNEGDGNRWINVYSRADTLVPHFTSLRIFNATMRSTNAVNANPSYGGNDLPIRVLTFVNNRADTISYDRPDGLGTATLSSAMASVWIYHYAGVNAGTWENVFPEYVFAPTLTTLGAVINNFYFHVDNNAALRSFDIDNIEVLGSREPIPPVHVETPHLLFSEDFNSYAPNTAPTTVDAGGKWGTATWNGSFGSWGVVTDDSNEFGEGNENRFFRATSTHNLNPGLISPVFEPQEVVTYAFDFIGRVYEGDDNRWLNVDVRSGTQAAHLTSIRMFNATMRSTSANPSYGGNNLRIRIFTIVNNKEGPIIYNRPDGQGTADLGPMKASVWIYHYTTETWENVFPEYIYSRSGTITTGAVIDNLRFFMDSNTQPRSFDMDNIEVYGSIEPSAPAVVLNVALSGGNVELRWNGLTGKTYQVQYRDNLGVGDWINLGESVTPGADGEQVFADAIGEEQRFYQIKEITDAP